MFVTQCPYQADAQQEKSVEVKKGISPEGRTFIKVDNFVESDEEILVRLGVPIEKINQVMTHSLTFADLETGLITLESVKHRLITLGLNSLRAAASAATIVGALTLKLGWNKRVQDVLELMHAVDTQIWDKSGLFSEERFKAKMAQYDKENKGYLTKEEIDQMIQDDRLRDQKAGVRYCTLAQSTLASKGEFGLFYEIFQEEDGSLKIEKLRKMWVEGTTVWREKILEIQSKANQETDGL